MLGLANDLTLLDTMKKERRALRRKAVRRIEKLRPLLGEPRLDGLPPA